MTKWGNNSKVGLLINHYASEKITDEQLNMRPRNQAPRTRIETLPSPRGKRMSSLPAIQHRNSAKPNRRTKSISVRAKNTTATRRSQHPAELDE